MYDPILRRPPCYVRCLAFDTADAPIHTAQLSTKGSILRHRTGSIFRDYHEDVMPAQRRFFVEHRPAKQRLPPEPFPVIPSPVRGLEFPRAAEPGRASPAIKILFQSHVDCGKIPYGAPCSTVLAKAGRFPFGRSLRGMARVQGLVCRRRLISVFVPRIATGSSSDGFRLLPNMLCRFSSGGDLLAVWGPPVLER